MIANLVGRCACEAVVFHVADDFQYAANCHCTLCRRATGSAFKPFGGIEVEKLHLVKGEANLKTVGNEIDHDIRCATCGSYLYSIVRGGAFAHVSYGSLVRSPTLKPFEHIFVGSKAEWYDILDDLPQHSQFAE